MTAAAWVQAIATVVLVIVTAIYVKLTRQLSKAAHTAARAAERGLILDAAPIILPRRTVGSGKVHGSLHNIGGRPAIEVNMEVFLGDVRVGQNDETLIRSGEQRNWEIVYDPNQAGITANALFTVTCTYGAMTGDEFRTIKRYQPGGQHEFEVFVRAEEQWQRLSIVEAEDDSLE